MINNKFEDPTKKGELFHTNNWIGFNFFEVISKGI